MRSIDTTPSRGGIALPRRTLCLLVLALGLYGLLGPAPAALVFDRQAVAQGEWWRLITGHWVHSEARHLIWDLAGLAVLGISFERLLGWRLLGALAAGMLAVDGWLWWGLPGLSRYCGLSGILNALLATGVLAVWHESRHPLALVLGALATAKLGLDLYTGQSFVADLAWPSVPTAHLAGLMAGLIIGAAEAGL